MSVTGFMYNINATKKLGELELNAGLEGNRSWHHQFKDSAYIYIGGLHPGLTEGDVVILFSQFGEIVDVNLIRDKQTGKPKGFAYICYEDQRSTVLAVDNMNGYQLLKRTLRVDHVTKYKAPKKLDEDDRDEEGDPKLLEYKATGAEGGGQGVYNVTKGQQTIDEVVKGRKVATSKAAVEDEDEAWAKAFEESLKKGGDGKEKKKKKDKKDLKKDKKQLKEMLKEAKRLKKETKRAKREAKMMKKVKKEGKSKSSVKMEPSSSSESSSDDEDSDDSESEKPKKRKK